MRSLFRKLFNLIPGEENKTLAFSALSFLWAMGGYGALTLSEGMFLQHVGASKLPMAYLLIAGLMTFLSTILLISLRRLALSALLTVLLFGSLLSLALVVPWIGQEGSWVAFKVIGWMIPVAISTCFWSFIDQYYDLQGIKRTFALFNAMIFLGDATSSALISLTLGRWGVSGILLFFIGTLLLAIPFVFFITRHLTPVLEEHQESVHATSTLSFKELLRTLFSSRFTQLLMAFYFVMQLLALTTEFNYLASFERLLPKDPEGNELTQFLATCTMWISLGNMVFGLFFYSRLVKKMGIQNVLLIAPLFFTLLASAWMGRDLLPLAFCGLLAREGFTYAFDDNNLNLLIVGVPSRIKNQVRIAIESFCEPLGMLLTALMLLVLTPMSRQLALLFALLTLLTALTLRRSYPRALFHNLVASSISFGKRATEWLSSLAHREKKEVEAHLLRYLNEKDETVRLLAFESLLELGEERLVPKLLTQFSRLSIPGKLRALELLSASSHASAPIVVERIERLRKSLAHPQLASAIHCYFVRHALPLPRKEREIREERISALLASTEERDLCMGLSLCALHKQSGAIPELLPFLTHPLVAICRVAAATLASLISPEERRWGSSLLHYLKQVGDRKTRFYLFDALEQMQDLSLLRPLILEGAGAPPIEQRRLQKLILSLGLPAKTPLIDCIQEEKLPLRARLLAAKIANKLSPASLRLHLAELLKKEVDRTYFYLYYACRADRGSLLEQMLYAGYEAMIDFIVHLLAFSGSMEEGELLVHTLKSKNQKARAHAREILERGSSSHLFALVAPLFEEEPLLSKAERYRGERSLPLSALLDHFELSPSFAEKLIASSLKADLMEPILL